MVQREEKPSMRNTESDLGDKTEQEYSQDRIFKSKSHVDERMTGFSMVEKEEEDFEFKEARGAVMAV